MIPLLLATAALACLLGSVLLLRSLGARYRIGRLLSATRLVDISEARELAGEGAPYLRVNGRISSDEEFPDEHDRPLVYRRKRIEIATRAGWTPIADEREAVPFGVQARDAYVGVDIDAIGPGLVAIPRQSEGRLSDLPADLAADAPALAGTAGDPPTRLVIEQLSAVEHATVCGVPVLRGGAVLLTAGHGRPLIVTTLEVPAAMRLLAAGHRRRVLLSSVLLGAAAVLGVALLGALLAGV